MYLVLKISYEHFFHTFKKNAGMTPKEYINAYYNHEFGEYHKTTTHTFTGGCSDIYIYYFIETHSDIALPTDFPTSLYAC